MISRRPNHAIGLFILITLFSSGLMLTACSDDNATSSDLGAVNRIFQWGADNPTYLVATTTASEVIDFSGVGLAAINDGESNGEAIVFDGKAFATDSTGQVKEFDGDDTIIVSGVTSNFQPTTVSTTSESID